MRISVLINNFNYETYVAEAVESAYQQTFPPHEILVVDDGSTDRSREILADLANRIPILRIIEKPNGGQLSAFQTGVNAATGDWCFFLDADDTYLPDHLAAAVEKLTSHPQATVYYCDQQETQGPPIFRSKWTPGLIGPVPYLILTTRISICMITSTIGMQTRLAKSILALDDSFLEDWRIRADDCLLYGAALAGGIFYYNAISTVQYRIHGTNNFANQNNEIKKYQHEFRLQRIFTHYKNRFGLLDDAKTLLYLLREYFQAPWHQRDSKIRSKFFRAIRKAPVFFPKKIIAATRLYTQRS